MRYFVTIAGRTFDVDLGSHGIRVDGADVSAQLDHVEGTPLRSLLMDGASVRILAFQEGKGSWTMNLRGRRLSAEAVDERTRAIREMTAAAGVAAGPKPIRAPMPGMVVKVEVAPGDRVEAGQGVLIVEAMKMENELKAEAPGVVARVHVAPGQAVEKDQILIDLDPVEGADAR